MVQVDGGARAVILAGGMNHRGILETSQIFGEGILVESRGGEAIEARFEPKLGAVANHRFRERRLLNQKEPVKTGSGPFLGDVVKKLVGRNNIENSDFGHAFGVIESHAVRYPPAAVVAQ